MTTDGGQLEFRLKEVDLDGQQLVGLDPHGAPETIPLSRVEAVWHRRPLVWRSAAVWIGGGIAGGLLGSIEGVLSALLGALFGFVGGAFVSWLLHDSRALYEWTEMYGGGAA